MQWLLGRKALLYKWFDRFRGGQIMQSMHEFEAERFFEKVVPAVFDWANARHWNRCIDARNGQILSLVRGTIGSRR
jgi:hypothetical protein